MWGYPGGSKPTGRLYEHVFLVPQKGGDWRPIINLKILNQYVAKQHFKMEDIRTLKDIIRRRDYMVKLDLKDAYFSVPVVDNDRKYLRFEWASRLYEYTCLPFGLTSTPWIFKKLFSSSIFTTTGSPLSDVSRRQAPSRQLSRGSQGEF